MLDEVSGNVTQLHVPPLRELTQGGERLIGVTVVADHDDPLGLPDEVARPDGLVELIDEIADGP